MLTSLASVLDLSGRTPPYVPPPRRTPRSQDDDLGWDVPPEQERPAVTIDRPTRSREPSHAAPARDATAPWPASAPRPQRQSWNADRVPLFVGRPVASVLLLSATGALAVVQVAGTGLFDSGPPTWVTLLLTLGIGVLLLALLAFVPLVRPRPLHSKTSLLLALLLAIRKDAPEWRPDYNHLRRLAVTTAIAFVLAATVLWSGPFSFGGDVFTAVTILSVGVLVVVPIHLVVATWADELRQGTDRTRGQHGQSEAP